MHNTCLHPALDELPFDLPGWQLPFNIVSSPHMANKSVEAYLDTFEVMAERKDWSPVKLRCTTPEKEAVTIKWAVTF